MVVWIPDEMLGYDLVWASWSAKRARDREILEPAG